MISDIAPSAKPSAGDQVIVECDSVVKRYGGVTALKGACFTLKRGEVHALLGQNGAGKSTLIKILCGVVQRDGGAIRIGGAVVHFGSARASQEAGVAVVHQDLSLAPNLSIAGSLLLGREPRSLLGLIDRKAMMKSARKIMSEFNLALDVGTIVGSLPFPQRQLLEIAKALSRNPRILILDEPTSALSENEERVLFRAIKALQARGVGVIYITHRLKEVFEIADRVTVFRDGIDVLACDTRDTDLPSLVAAIAGSTKRAVGNIAPVNLAAPVRLKLDGLTATRVNGASLELRRGEIVGLAGMVGSGRTELLEAIYGVNLSHRGSMSIDGVLYEPRSPAQAIARGVALVPGDRHVQGLALDHSINSNITIARLPSFGRFGLLQRGKVRQRSGRIIGRLAIKARNYTVAARTLSGGNQQKVVFGKWLEPDPGILLLDEPTIGVDVGARPEIYAAVRQMAENGTSVMVVSSEMEELLLLCSRIAIVRAGRLVRWVARADLAGEEDLHRLVQVNS